MLLEGGAHTLPMPCPGLFQLSKPYSFKIISVVFSTLPAPSASKSQVFLYMGSPCVVQSTELLPVAGQRAAVCYGQRVERAVYKAYSAVLPERAHIFLPQYGAAAVAITTALLADISLITSVSVSRNSDSPPRRKSPLSASFCVRRFPCQCR